MRLVSLRWDWPPVPVAKAKIWCALRPSITTSPAFVVCPSISIASMVVLLIVGRMLPRAKIVPVTLIWIQVRGRPAVPGVQSWSAGVVIGQVTVIAARSEH